MTRLVHEKIASHIFHHEEAPKQQDLKKNHKVWSHVRNADANAGAIEGATNGLTISANIIEVMLINSNDESPKVERSRKIEDTSE